MRTIRPVYTGPWRKGTLAGLGDYRGRIRPTDLPPFRASLAGGRINRRRDNADASGRQSGLGRLHDIPCKASCKTSCKILCKPVTPALRTANHTVCRYHMVSDTIAVADDFWHSGTAASDGASLNDTFLPRLPSHLCSEDFR
jgi:hypothetical protein